MNLKLVDRLYLAVTNQGKLSIVRGVALAGNERAGILQQRIDYRQ